MKVAVSSTGNDLDSLIDPRFGRCPFFVVLNTDDMCFDCYENENCGFSSGAGIQAAGFVADKGIEAVLTGNCGPKAMAVFDTAGIRVFTGMSGTVGEVVERFRAGGVSPAAAPMAAQGCPPPVQGRGGGAVPAYGMGRCRGGGGRGMGMGMGRGGRGMATGVSGVGVGPSPNSGEDSPESLHRQMEGLKRQVEFIQGKIDQLGRKRRPPNG